MKSAVELISLQTSSQWGGEVGGVGGALGEGPAVVQSSESLYTVLEILISFHFLLPNGTYYYFKQSQQTTLTYFSDHIRQMSYYQQYHDKLLNNKIIIMHFGPHFCLQDVALDHFFIFVGFPC